MTSLSYISVYPCFTDNPNIYMNVIILYINDKIKTTSK